MQDHRRAGKGAEKAIRVGGLVFECQNHFTQTAEFLENLGLEGQVFFLPGGLQVQDHLAALVSGNRETGGRECFECALPHARVIAAVEDEFGIRFRTLELIALRNVGELQELIDKQNRDRP